MTTVFKREFLAYFRTPVGYVFLGVYLALAGLLFNAAILDTLSGELLIFLSQLTYLFMLLSPVLAMRLLCEDRQKKTDQLLLTSPVPLGKIVLGKFLAGAAVLGIAVLLTNVYVLVMQLYGTVYPGEWFVGYVGFMLQGLCYLALDLLVSCFAKNQVTAAVLGFGANFLLWMLDLLADSATGAVRSVIEFVSLYQRYQPFVLGQLSPANLLYFVCFIALCLVATTHVLDARRFAEGGAA